MNAFLRNDRPGSRCAAAAACLSILLGLAAPAAADQRPKWELGIGSVFYTQPDYVGSDEYRFHAIPFPWIIYRGPRLRVDRESMQTKIFGTDLVRLDLSAGGQIPVDSSHNDRRHGMRDLDWMLQLGPSLKFKVLTSEDGRHTLDVDVPLRVALAIDTDNFSYEGLVSSPKVVYRYEPDKWRFEANAGLEFSSNDYNDYVYDVSARYATPTRRAWDGKGGYGGVRISAGLSRYFGPFYVGAFLRYINVAGAAFQNSPLVGTDNAVMGGIAIGWIWMKSDEMVPVGAEANLASRRSDLAEAPAAPATDESAASAAGDSTSSADATKAAAGDAATSSKSEGAASSPEAETKMPQRAASNPEAAAKSNTGASSAPASTKSAPAAKPASAAEPR